MGGLISGVSVAVLVQLIAMERRTCCLTLHQGPESGTLHFVNGELLDATVKDLRGEGAVAAMLAQGDCAAAQIRLGVDHPSRSIGGSVPAVLLAAMASADEHRWATGQATRLPVQAREVGSMSLDAIIGTIRDEIAEFVATDVISLESGLSVAGAAVEAEFDASAAPAAFAEVVKANRYAFQLLTKGLDQTEDILISTDAFYVLLRMLTAEYCLLLAISRKGSLGLARAIMRKHAPELRAALGGLG